MLWLVWAALLTPLAIGYDLLANVLLGGGGDISFMLLVAAEVALVASIGIAVVRYRLYAIERLVNRTLVYVTLIAAARRCVRGDHARARGRRRRAARTGSSRWRRSPSRSRSGRCARGCRIVVDRRFSRARYEGVRRVREFEDEVREGRREPEEIVSVLAEALRDPLAELFFWLPASGAYADASGESSRRCRRTGARARDRARGARTARAAPRPEPARAAGPAARRPRRSRALDRDRTAARRGAAPARRGRGLSRADRRGGLRGAPAARARPPRRCTAAARLPRRPDPAPPATLPGEARSSRPRSIRSWRRSEPRSRTCARSQPASAPRGSTTGSPQRLRDLARTVTRARRGRRAERARRRRASRRPPTSWRARRSPTR